MQQKLWLYFILTSQVSLSEKCYTKKKKKNIYPVQREAPCIALCFLFWAPEQGTMCHFQVEQKVPSLQKCWERWQLENQSLGGQVACLSPNRKLAIHADFNVWPYLLQNEVRLPSFKNMCTFNSNSGWLWLWEIRCESNENKL